MGLYTKVAGVWQEIGATEMQWAEVSGGTLTTYTKGDGTPMRVHSFTSSGTLTVDVAGYAEVFAVSGGNGYHDLASWLPTASPNWPSGIGTCGRVVQGIFWLPAGALTVTRGAGGAGGASAQAATASKIGTIVNTGRSPGVGGGSSGDGAGVTTTIRGSSETFASGSANPGAANTGQAGSASGTTSYAGGSGLVVVAVPAP